MMKYKLAIDFGTTNSAVACWDEAARRGQTIELPSLSSPAGSGAHLVPSLLYVRDGRCDDLLVGQQVRAQGLDTQPGNRLFRSFKRAIGAETLFEARLIDGVPWTDEQAGKHFLHRIFEALPYQPDEIEQLVITVPVAAFDGYTAWLSSAIENLPAGRIRIVDESSAAALGYAVSEPGAIVLMVDFGGGTLDLSLVRLPQAGSGASGAKAQVIAKAGASLGGSDIDQWLCQEALARSQVSAGDLGAGYGALLSACERAKIALSTAGETTIVFQDGKGAPHSLPFTRAELEELLRRNGLHLALTQALEKVLGLAHQKGVYREDIRHVLLVGGTALIPSVQQTLDAFFRAITDRQRKSITQMPAWPASTWTVENTSIRVDKPFTAVVEGALLVAAGFGLDDQLAHGYGLRYLDASGQERFDEIIPMGSKVPLERPVSVILGASRPGQETVEFVIGQIESDATSGPRIIPLNAAQPPSVSLRPPGMPGRDRLRAEFRMDAARRLRMTVTDLKTRRKLLDDIPAAALTPELPAQAATVRSGAEPALARRPRGGFSLPGLASFFDLLAPGRVSARSLAAALRSDDSLARFDAAEALARRGDRDARLAFEEILTSGAPHQRASAAQHVHRFSWFGAQPLYLKALADADTRVREAAVFSLCKMRLPVAYALVTETLPTGGDALLRAAVWGMYDHPDPAAVPVLKVALRAADPGIRELALEVLGASEAPEAIPVVKAMLSDPSLEVQYAATLSWVELARAECFGELAGWIEQTSGQQRQAILRGLFHAANYMGIETGTAPAALALIQALIAALGDDLPETRLAACLPLAWARHPLAESGLLEGFRHETDGQIRARMLSAAVHLMSPCAGQLLVEAGRDPDLLVRQTAEHLEQG